MNEEDIDFEDSSEVVVLPSRPMSRLDLLIRSIWMAQTGSALLSQWLDGFNDMLMMHSNHKFDRSAMAEQAALELETMIGGDSDG